MDLVKIKSSFISPQWGHLVTQNLVSTGSGNGLVPNGIRPLLESILSYYIKGPAAFTWEQFHKIFSTYQSLKWVLQVHIQNSSHISHEVNDLTRETLNAAYINTHWGQVTHKCVNKPDIIGRHQAIIWTNAGILLIRTLRNKVQWNVKQNSYIFIQENIFENDVCGMAAILSRPQCVNHWILLKFCTKLNTHNVMEKKLRQHAIFVWISGHGCTSWATTWSRIHARLLMPFWTD